MFCGENAISVSSAWPHSAAMQAADGGTPSVAYAHAKLAWACRDYFQRREQISIQQLKKACGPICQDLCPAHKQIQKAQQGFIPSCQQRLPQSPTRNTHCYCSLNSQAKVFSNRHAGKDVGQEAQDII